MKKAPSNGASPAAAFIARKIIVLPIPGPSGLKLSVELQAISWEDMVETTEHLPGGIPDGKPRTKPGEPKTEEGLDPEVVGDFQAMLEQIQNSRHDYKLMLPVVSRLVSLAVVAPRFSFALAAGHDEVPWSALDVRNQAALFTEIMAMNGYGGGAAERVETFRDGKHGRRDGRVRGVRPGKVR